ncbi:MAG: DUF2017 family protein [Planctomycetota bacterium]
MIKIHRQADNKVIVQLGRDEAMILRILPGRLREVIEDPDANARVTRRLFPTAYKDKTKDAEYQRLLGDDLKRRKLEGVKTFESTLARMRLVKDGYVEFHIEAEEYEFWLGFVNDFRLMLGTELDIRDDDWEEHVQPNDPRAHDYALLHYLTWLEDELVRASGYDFESISMEDIEGGEDDDDSEFPDFPDFEDDDVSGSGDSGESR